MVLRLEGYDGDELAEARTLRFSVSDLRCRRVLWLGILSLTPGGMLAGTTDDWVASELVGGIVKLDPTGGAPGQRARDAHDPACLYHRRLGGQ